VLQAVSITPDMAVNYFCPDFPVIDPTQYLLRSERKQGFSADPFYGRARCSPMLGSFKT